MSNIRSLFDSDDGQQHDNDPNATSSFTGGEKSGLAVFNPPEPGQKPPDNRFIVTVYRNGFQVNGGPFRDTSIPENARALQDMRQGIAPLEIQEAVVASGQNMREVQVMVNQKDEDYTGPTTEATTNSDDHGGLFAGHGQTLGGSAGPKVETHTGTTVDLDNSKPLATIQFRFPDGQRKVQKFNLDSHRVSDVVAFAASCIGADSTALTLACGFPPKPLTDLSLTVREAGLDGSAVTVKLN
ncbi:Pb-reticulocyte binding protein, putative [Perkinsus marinus ATCC 50983]|uniref:Pb-reticulocyte binding protein, putative n=1 Tax=Perkinsus marinus (strain ATCC 50983 / TXsc) TaxID=423536 RepID=C5L6H5_PERM5|nr:Pb-reticulocyte binding protein, putative [Perkinsus marinus ATCC 50983]EER07636.1 Pb-reticulocyte binding protein, putative [Perkinsus marinus ATCC 50983]|eukprot:XP_002775820.1 Pb-reticulocyte binding protein, putative [Perkinsus marinus ATCC 50983]